MGSEFKLTLHTSQFAKQLASNCQKRKLHSEIAKFGKMQSCEIFACSTEALAVLGKLL